MLPIALLLAHPASPNTLYLCPESDRSPNLHIPGTLGLPAVATVFLAKLKREHPIQHYQGFLASL